MDGGGYVVRISEDRIRLPSERLDDLRERAGPHPATPGPWRRLGARHAGRLAARPVGEYGVLGWHDGSPAFMVAQVFCSPRCSRGSVCRAPRRIALRALMTSRALSGPWIEGRERTGEDYASHNLWCISRSSETTRRTSATTTPASSGGSSTRPHRWPKRCRSQGATVSWTSSPLKMGQASEVVSEADRATRATPSSTSASQMSRLHCSERRSRRHSGHGSSDITEWSCRRSLHGSRGHPGRCRWRRMSAASVSNRASLRGPARRLSGSSGSSSMRSESDETAGRSP